MTSARRPPFLKRFSGNLRRPQEPDLADMGTAFALEFVMDQPPLEEAKPAAAAPVARAPWRQWLGEKFGR